MARSLFSKSNPHCCIYCLHGRVSDRGDKILCRHAGIVSPDYGCRRFRYNPLNRVPHRHAALPSYSKEDFKL